MLYLDDPEIFHGVPIGLQIVGRRLEEERILAISEEVERCLSKQEVSK
jgi:amidase